MSPLPDVTVIIRDGALGITPPNSANVQAKVGIANSGPFTVQTIGDIQTLLNTYGGGPLVEAAAHVLEVAGGPVVCLRVAASSAGSVGSYTHTGTGTSVMSTSAGTPLDDNQLVVQVVTGNALVSSGLGVVQYSLDGGLTFSGNTSVPASGLVVVGATGVTIALVTSGSLVAGDTYSASFVGPTLSNTDVNTALTLLMANSATWFLVHVVGVPASSAAAATLASTLDTQLTAAASAGNRYAMGLVDLPQDTDANLITAFASFVSKRVGFSAGFVNLTSVVSGVEYLRPSSWAAAARFSLIPPQEDLGRVATGPIAGALVISRDEFKTPALDAKQFITTRTIVGLPGFYFTQGNLPAGSTSDYQYAQYRRVMDIACAAGRVALLQYVNTTFRVNRATGFILEADAQMVEAHVTAAIQAQVTTPGYADAVQAVVSRNIAMLSTRQLYCTVRVLPKAYAKYITEDIGFFNPALTLSGTQAAAA